jgi:hypothetical protein
MNDKNVGAFTKIYADRIWGNGSEDSPLSGLGSAPKYAKPYVQLVSNAISDFSIKHVLDVGHGDWAMWRDYQFENTSYVGVDVAEGISKTNMRLFGSSTRKFLQVDFSSALPEADLVICKDVLQHLSNDEILQILEKFRKYKYVVICNSHANPKTFFEKLRFYARPKDRFRSLVRFNSPFFTVKRNNADIQNGQYRTLDIFDEPFSGWLRDFELLTVLNYPAEESHRGIQKQALLMKRKINSFCD